VIVVRSRNAAETFALRVTEPASADKNEKVYTLRH
jgi:hypothetical protein